MSEIHTTMIHHNYAAVLTLLTQRCRHCREFDLAIVIIRFWSQQSSNVFHCFHDPELRRSTGLISKFTIMPRMQSVVVCKHLSVAWNSVVVGPSVLEALYRMPKISFKERFYQKHSSCKARDCDERYYKATDEQITSHANV